MYEIEYNPNHETFFVLDYQHPPAPDDHAVGEIYMFNGEWKIRFFWMRGWDQKTAQWVVDVLEQFNSSTRTIMMQRYVR